MSTIAQQLRLAANILETGHPWEYYAPFRAGQPDPHWERASTRDEPVHHVHNRREIHPVLATPPYKAELHNPDNLTAEQVGVGYRLVVKNDSCDQPHDLWSCEKREWVQGARVCCTFGDSGYTYRLPLSVPWPTPPIDPYRLPLSVPWPPAPIDPYAELKAAHAAGKVIQCEQDYKGSGNWLMLSKILWDEEPCRYRIKPESPPFQLPPPPPGMQWHRVDGWKAEDLPPGTRPHVLDEEDYPEDSERRADGWRSCIRQKYGTTGEDFHRRTTRPLVFEHAGKSWTYHRPGDPMPCDRRALIWCVYDDGTCSLNAYCAANYAFGRIIGWRYAEPATKEVELGPCDVPPGSVFRLDKWDHAYTSGAVFLNGVHLLWPISQAVKFLRWSELQKEWLINRPSHRDADGNPTKWEKCSKTITTP